MELLSQLSAQRLALADQLERLTADQWATPSLAAGWTVRHVVAHVVMPFRYSKAKIASKYLLNGCDFNRMADQIARADSTLSTAQLTETLRCNADNPFTPPGAGLEAPLTDLVMHTLDICRPLGIHVGRSADTSRVVLDSLTTTQSLKFFGVDLTDIRLNATDIDWTSGVGRDVFASSDDLILILGGRQVAATSLSGVTATNLANRIAARS